MKRSSHFPVILALLFLAGGCTLPPVKQPPPLATRETPAEKAPQPEKPATAVHPEPKGKRVSLIPKENSTQTTPKEETAQPNPEIQPAPPAPVQDVQPPIQCQTQVFTDYNTGLTFTYPRPWRVVATQGEGSILGRDGGSQLTVRFAILTTDKEKSTQRGYIYVPSDSLAGTIGKTLKAILGVEDNETIQEKTPIDVLLTQKHFPNLIIEKRYRGNDGGVVVQKCRYKELPGAIQVYHIFIGDRVASFSLAEVKNRLIKLEMQQIVLSTKKP